MLIWAGAPQLPALPTTLCKPEVVCFILPVAAFMIDRHAGTVHFL